MTPPERPEPPSVVDRLPLLPAPPRDLVFEALADAYEDVHGGDGLSSEAATGEELFDEDGGVHLRLGRPLGPRA